MGLQDEHMRALQAQEAKSSGLQSQLTAERNALTSELESSRAQKQELKAQLKSQQRETENAVAREKADAAQQLQAKDTKNRELQTQLVDKSALNEKIRCVSPSLRFI